MEPQAPLWGHRHRCGAPGTAVEPQAPLWSPRHRCGAPGTAVEPLYDGPFTVVQHGEKVFHILVLVKAKV